MTVQLIPAESLGCVPYVDAITLWLLSIKKKITFSRLILSDDVSAIWNSVLKHVLCMADLGSKRPHTLRLRRVQPLQRVQWKWWRSLHQSWLKNVSSLLFIYCNRFEHVVLRCRSHKSGLGIDLYCHCYMGTALILVCR